VWRGRGRLDEEVAAHLDEETADNIARGMDPAAARQAALRTFGNVEAAKETVRERHPWYWLDTLSQDIGFAFRLIGRNRWLSATIIGTLTVGIAINVSTFTLVNGFLLRPWVRTDPATVFSVFPRYSGDYELQYSDGGLSQPDYARLRDSAGSVAALAAYASMKLTLGGNVSGTIRAGLVTCNMADVLRSEPALYGRYLAAHECDASDPAPVAVLSETAWRTRFGGAADVVGRTIQLNRAPFTIVGVAPRLVLPRPGNESEVWVPYAALEQLRPPGEHFRFADPRAQWLTVIGRRRPERSLPQLAEEVRAIARRGDEDVPGRQMSLTVTSGALIEDPDFRGRAPVLFAVTLGTTTVLLLLACVNVTTLLLSRSAARRREVAVRLSLGAGRFRLLRQFLTEGLVLSGLAAAASVIVVQRAPGLLWASLMSAPAPFDFRPDWKVLSYCLFIGVATGVIAGLSPSFDSLKPHVAESLKGSSGAVTSGPRRSRLRNTLVAVQIALSFLLVVEVVLAAKAQRRYFSYDPGFETAHVLNITFASVLAGFSPPLSFYEAVESRIRSVPGVMEVSFASIAPWSGRNSTTVRELDGQPVPITANFRDDPAQRGVTPEYFKALDIPLVRGRIFTPHEASPVHVPVVISEAMARRYWPGQDPLGRQFRLGNRRQNLPRSPTVQEVVGVCRDVQSVQFLQDDGAFYYRPLDLRRTKPPYMLVRVSGDPQGPAAAIRDIVRNGDPQMAVTVATLASRVHEQGEQMKPMMVYGAAAGILALLLAVTGVYAVVSFSVSQRVREIGIRTALGAQRSDVLVLILRSGVTPVVGGLAAGVALALAAAAVMRSVLVGVNPRDPATFVVVSSLLLGVAAGAIWIPARRAAALDPVTSLRCE
jgi:predicted permease